MEEDSIILARQDPYHEDPICDETGHPIPGPSRQRNVAANPRKRNRRHCNCGKECYTEDSPCCEKEKFV